MQAHAFRNTRSDEEVVTVTEVTKPLVADILEISKKSIKASNLADQSIQKSLAVFPEKRLNPTSGVASGFCSYDSKKVLEPLAGLRQERLTGRAWALQTY